MIAIASPFQLPVRLTYGAHDLLANISGLSVVEARIAYTDILNVSEGIEAYLNEKFVEDWHDRLSGGDRLEFMRTWGWKGAGQITRQEIWHGDCLQLMPRLDTGSVNIVATSPPYNIGVRYDSYNDLRPDAEYRGWLDQVFRQVQRVLTDDGSFFLIVGSTPRMPRRAFDIADIAARHFQTQSRIIWVKSLAIDDRTLGHYQPINSERFLHHNYEEVFHFTKTGEVPLDRNAIGVPYTEEVALKRWKRAAQGLHCRGDVWFVPYPTVREPKAHPATFPPKLVEMCIRLHGVNRDTFFLDPFAGIGNSLSACQRLGVRGVGMELSEKYVAEARRRLANFQPSDELLEFHGALNGFVEPVIPASLEKTFEPTDKPFIDIDRFRVRWKGKECPLRNGKPFRLFERLNSRPGAYVRVEDLIDELWPDNVVERNTVQKTASRLQRLLRAAGMKDLVIDGKTNPGHYALVISSAGSQ